MIDKNCRKHNGDMIEQASLDETVEFFNWLQGKELEGFSFENKDDFPKLTPRQAFKIIYVLQEAFGFIPDSIELCSNCNNLFDMYEEGDCINGHYYCEDCICLRTL